MKKGITLKLRGFLPHHRHVVLGDLGREPGQLCDPRQVRLVRPTVQRRLARRADVRWFHVDDARDGVTRWSVLEGKRALPGSAPGGLRVGLGRLAAVRRDVAFDLPFQLLNALLQAGILFGQQLDLGYQLAVLGDQEGDLCRLLGILLQQRFANRLLRHALRIPGGASVCYLLRGR
jgi:hypothetical protein